MIQAYTRLRIADNTGAKQIMCINVLVGARKYAYIGDIIVATVKRAIPHGMVKEGEVVRAVVVRVAKPYRRSDGSYIKWLCVWLSPIAALTAPISNLMKMPQSFLVIGIILRAAVFLVL